jgi:hypothetical protein
MGEFPEGEAPGQSGDQAAQGGGEPGFEDVAGGGDGDGGSGEPGFGDGAGGSDALPDLLDEPSFEEVLGAMEEAMGQPGGAAGETAGTGGMPQGGQPGGQQGSSNAYPGGYGNGSEASATPGSGGPLTPAEQVAILDARLEQGTGEFDAMILEEQAAQRDAARQRPAPAIPQEPASTPSGGGGYGGSGPYEGGVADGGGYSTGGGMGGASAGGGQIPQNTAKYPPPEDIPTGNDDDVVARQLREAAMREPDPKVREKLWDEYRKYKGISP